ncbi:MAG: hypothetical protein NXI24_23760 [bacterium]|nr:hypothetical protein [bacterium]
MNSETKPVTGNPKDHMNQQAGESSEQVTRCVCGEYSTDHPQVIIHPEYSFTGWFLLAFGVTVSPKRIVYQCKCGRKFAASTDPDVLARYI